MFCSRIIWLGDLNYRVALSYEETRVLLEDNDWDTLLEKDQVCVCALIHILSKLKENISINIFYIGKFIDLYFIVCS